MINRAAIGYLILSIGVGVGLWFSNENANRIEQERIERSIEVNSFLMKQCKREAFRDKIIIGALEDAKRRALASIGDPEKRDFEVSRLQDSIDQLSRQINQCEKDIPSSG